MTKLTDRSRGVQTDVSNFKDETDLVTIESCRRSSTTTPADPRLRSRQISGIAVKAASRDTVIVSVVVQVAVRWRRSAQARALVAKPHDVEGCADGREAVRVGDSRGPALDVGVADLDDQAALPAYEVAVPAGGGSAPPVGGFARTHAEQLDVAVVGERLQGSIDRG